MNRALLGAAIMAIWALSGVAIGLRTARRGHFAPAWLILGVVLGPFTWGLWRTSRERHNEATPQVVARGTQGAGPIDALIGLDGSPEANAALDSIVALFGERLGRVTLATVTDYDTAIEPPETGHADRARAMADLEHAARRLTSQGIEPQIVMLAGRPCDALRDYAEAQGDELLVIGGRGRGMSKAILGSTAAALTHGCTLPVLVVSTTPSPEQPR